MASVDSTGTAALGGAGAPPKAAAVAALATRGEEESKPSEGVLVAAGGAGSGGGAEAASPRRAATPVAVETTLAAEEEDVRNPVVEVGVSSSRESSEVSGGKTRSFTEFLVVSVRADGARHETWRRFEDFAELHAGLRALGLSEKDGLELPPSRWYLSLVRAHPDFVVLRQSLLDNYLRAVLASAAGRLSVVFRAFLRPTLRHDWPSSLGAIDLMKHDLPHESSVTEWWYFNTHFTGADGRKYSAFAAFFRILKHKDEKTGERTYAHALNWAFSDVEERKFFQESVLDQASPSIIKKSIEKGFVIKDSRLKRAYMEILEKGNVPLPDRMFERDVVCTEDRLELDFQFAQLTKDAAGSYLLRCNTRDGKHAIDFRVEPQKKPVRHGLDGVVKGHNGDDMFYYLIPRCRVTGHFTANGVRQAVTEGQGWFDHEFGGARDDEDDTSMNYGWNWAAIQLDNNMDISVALLVDNRPGAMREMERRAIVIDADSNRSQPTDLIFEGIGDPWTSVRSFNEYPLEWRVALPSAGIDLRLRASFADQEFVTLIAKPAFWEGRVEVEGVVNGKAVKGLGYVERNGFQVLSELNSFFYRVGKETRRAVRRVYPDNPNYDQVQALIASEDTPQYMRGVPLDVIFDKLIKPVRHISDEGGKSWRSYGALACMDIVGGDSRKFVKWLAMPEFMHVGSLIIDDFQDKSELRRGVPCVHRVWGDAIAINAGTAAYFQGQRILLQGGELDTPTLNKVYDLYFAALRAGHAGQALDIAGLDYLMEDAIENGKADLLEERVLAVHMLKTAAPAGSLARMGAVVGGGTKEQIEAVGLFFENVGVAFQIMDDVLNLRGLVTGDADKKKGVILKSLGEDITAGKVTFPVAKAVRILPKEEMRALWAVISSKPSDPHVVAECIEKLESCGAVEDCVGQARRLVEEGWAALDAVIPDSFAKIMLRSFGSFVIER